MRNFNTAFLSLPALPSDILSSAASDSEVVVRSIRTPNHGTYLAIINTGMTDKPSVTVNLPSDGKVTDAPTGDPIAASDGKVQMSLYPFQLRALRVQ